MTTPTKPAPGESTAWPHVEAVADDLALLQSPAVEEVYDGLTSILRSGLARPATTSVVGGGNA